jgi:chemotaxis protein CheX
MISEAEVNVFVSAVMNYFDKTVNQAAACGTPFLSMWQSPAVFDYSGIIQIDGKRRGMVLFTAPKTMLSVMLMRMHEPDMSHDNLCDLVGEIANTLSGNARRDFGHQFNISVPSIVSNRTGGGVDFPAAIRPIVIPIDWRNYHAKLVVCLDS